MQKYFLVVIFSVFTPTWVFGQATSITYQGQLKNIGTPANGSYNLVFKVFNAVSSGAQVGSTITRNGVAVTNGFFSQTLDFGAGVFTGQPRWMELTVNGVVLTPRQPLTATPYALYALSGPGGSGPWQASGANVFNTNAGNVGIGTNAPVAALQVQSSTAGAGDNTATFVAPAIGPYASHVHWGTTGDWYIRSAAATGKVVLQDFGGTVGIGTQSPQAKLHLYDPANSVSHKIQTGAGTNAWSRVEFANGDGLWSIGTSRNFNGNEFYFYREGSPNIAFAVQPNGGVTSESFAQGGRGVSGVNRHVNGGTGVYGEVHSAQTDDSAGVLGRNFATNGNGVIGEANTGTAAYGVAGLATQGYGVYGFGAIGVYGVSPNPSGWGVYSVGDMGVTEDLIVVKDLSVVGTKDFRIDHPHDPENKYLHHHCAEGPEPLNIYRGTVQLDANGEAKIDLPHYFEDINKDFSYVLTAVGAPMPNLHVGEEIVNNRFRVAGGPPGGRVCWEVKGMRNDLYMRQHGNRVEVDKPAHERGKYQRPELYGKPEEMGIHYRPASKRAAASTVEESSK